MLEPDEVFVRRLHRIEPRGGDLRIHVLVMAALKEDQRNCERVGLSEIQRDHLGEQVRGCELIAIPDVADLLVAIVGRKLGEIAIGGIVPAIGHHTAVITNPFALDVNVLDRNGLAGRAVGGDRFELALGLGVALTARGIHGKAPASTLAFGAVDQLADAYIGVQPFGVTLRELQAEKAAPAVAEDEYLVLAKLLASPGRYFLGVGDHALTCEGWRDLGRISKEIGFASGALVPLDDREIFLQRSEEPPAHRDRDVSRPAVDI